MARSRPAVIVALGVMRRLAVGSSASRVFAAQVVTTGLNVLATVVVARTMGLEGTGTLTVLIAASWILSVCFEFGLSSAAPYGMGRLGLKAEEIQTVYVAATVLVGLIAVLLCASPLASWSARLLRLGSEFTFQAAIFTGAALASTNMCKQLLMTCGRETVVAWLWPLDRAVLAVAVAIPVLGVGTQRDLPAAVLASGLVAFVAHWFAVLGLVGGRLVVPWPAIRAISRNSASVYASSVMQVLNYRLDALLVSAFAGASAVGIYGVAVSLANLLWYVPNAVSFVWLPKVSRLAPVDASRRTAEITRLTFRMVAVSALALALISRPLIRILWGESFVRASWAILALLPGVILFSVPKVLASDFIGRGRSRVMTEAAGLSLTLTVALDLLLIPAFGYMGAAVASSISYGVFAIYCVVRYRRMTGLSPLGLLFANEEHGTAVESEHV